MIQVYINYNNNLINNFKIIGHANSNQYGKDIVCAAVSVLSISTINGMEAIAHIYPKVENDNQNGGLLTMQLPKINNNNQMTKVQTLLKSFELGIKDITNDYARYVNLNIKKD